MERDSGISSGNNNKTDNNINSMTTNTNLSSATASEVDSVLTEAARATAVVLQPTLNRSSWSEKL